MSPRDHGPALELDYGAFRRHGVADSALHFERCGYVPLHRLLPADAVIRLRNEVDHIEPAARRRDFQMECMGGTPRHMTTVSGLAIAENSPAIVGLYHDVELVESISRLIERDLEPADDPVERHVLNMLHQGGDTHGFHTDDYPVALVMFIESPDCNLGCGRLEFCVTGNTDHAQTRSHQAGDAYVLRADRMNHRVQPIHDGCRRTVLNFAYGVKGHTVARTPSASMLYT